MNALAEFGGLRQIKNQLCPDVIPSVNADSTVRRCKKKSDE